MNRTLVASIILLLVVSPLSAAPSDARKASPATAAASKDEAQPKAKASAGRERKPIKKIPYFPVHGALHESPSELAALFSGGKAKTLRTFLKRLEKARTDPDVPAVVISLGQPQLGWAQVQDIRKAVEQLRGAKKDVYVFLENASAGKYLLASAATHITMVPEGEVFFLGLHAEQMYLKGLLDWLGLQADMMSMGDFKAAAEPLTRSGPSPEAEEQMKRLVADLGEQMVEMAAASRSLTKEEIKKFMDSGKVSARAALEAKLVDALGYRQDFIKRVQDKYGEDAKIVRNYGTKKGPTFDFSNPLVALRTLGQLFESVAPSKKTSIAVIYADGPISMGVSQEMIFGGKILGAATLRKAIDEARRDDTIKAAVLRIDSPGGSALASDIIWNATQKLVEKKPFIVSMGNVAGSGGYYIACEAQTIFAEPATITGSIGVVGGKLITMPMWNKIGLTFHETKFGKYADIFNTNRLFSEDERAVVFDWMEDVYGTFKKRVVDGRKGRLKGDIDALAGGRVYTGRQALEKGLVDELGSLEDAVRFAARQAKIDNYVIRILPQPKSFMDIFMEGVGGSDSEEIRTAPRFLQRRTGAGGLSEILDGLRRIAPDKAAALIRALFMLERLQDENVLTVMPGEILIR